VSDLTPAPNAATAFQWAFKRGREQASAFVALAAVVTILQFTQLIASGPLQNITADCLNPQTDGQVQACSLALSDALVPVGLSLLFWILAILATVGVQRAALRSTQGRPVGFSDMLTTQNLGRYVGFMLVFIVLVALGLVLCILPGLIVAFLLQLGPYYVLDRGAGVRQAMRDSSAVVRRNVGPAFIVLLVNAIAVLLGGTFYGLPTLVTLPLASLFTAHMYRQFNGEAIA
jgi:uncharacterized membrane protein